MKYLATAFCLTLGAWRLRLSIDIEDAPDDRTTHVVHHANRSADRHGSVR